MIIISFCFKNRILFAFLSTICIRETRSPLVIILFTGAATSLFLVIGVFLLHYHLTLRLGARRSQSSDSHLFKSFLFFSFPCKLVIFLSLLFLQRSIQLCTLLVFLPFFFFSRSPLPVLLSSQSLGRSLSFEFFSLLSFLLFPSLLLFPEILSHLLLSKHLFRLLFGGYLYSTLLSLKILPA